METEKPAFRLQRGDRLRCVDEQGGEPIDGVFIGPEDNSDFIVVPLSETKGHIQAGQHLRARCLFQGERVEFATVILEVIASPVMLWRLDPPKTVTPFDLRDHKRIQCSLSAKIEAIHKGRFVTGIIRNISKGGARCMFQLTDGGDSPFVMGDKITLRCAFPGIPGEQSALGRITELTPTEGELSVGIQFTESAWWVPPYH